MWLFAGLLYMYMRRWDSILYTGYIAGGVSAVYVLMMLLDLSGSVFPYMLPCLLCMILSLDPGRNVTCAVLAATDAVRAVMTVAGAGKTTRVLEAIEVPVSSF